MGRETSGSRRISLLLENSVNEIRIYPFSAVRIGRSTAMKNTTDYDCPYGGLTTINDFIYHFRNEELLVTADFKGEQRKFVVMMMTEVDNQIDGRSMSNDDKEKSRFSSILSGLYRYMFSFSKITHDSSGPIHPRLTRPFKQLEQRQQQ